MNAQTWSYHITWISMKSTELDGKKICMHEHGKLLPIVLSAFCLFIPIRNIKY